MNYCDGFVAEEGLPKSGGGEIKSTACRPTASAVFAVDTRVIAASSFCTEAISVCLGASAAIWAFNSETSLMHSSTAIRSVASSTGPTFMRSPLETRVAIELTVFAISLRKRVSRNNANTIHKHVWTNGTTAIRKLIHLAGSSSISHHPRFLAALPSFPPLNDLLQVT
jgi:hypothetical protein